MSFAENNVSDALRSNSEAVLFAALAYNVARAAASSPTAALSVEQKKDNDHGAELAAAQAIPDVASDHRQETKVIGGRCPRDGRHWENQCARCGSSLHWEECDNCGGEGWIEDDDWQADEGDGHDCDWCSAQGGHWACISSAQYCEGNPITDREHVTRGTVEWFTFDALPLAAPSLTTEVSFPTAASSAQKANSQNGTISDHQEQARASQEQHGAEWRLVRAGDVAPLDGGHGSWVETTHPAVITCMGSAPPCIEGGCQLNRQRIELEQARAEIESLRVAAEDARMGHDRLDQSSRMRDAKGTLYERISFLFEMDMRERAELFSNQLAAEKERDAALANVAAAQHRRCAAENRAHGFELQLAAQSDRDKQWLTALRHITSRVDTERILERMGYTEQEITDAIR